MNSKLKKFLSIIFFIIFISWILITFYKINEKNYTKIKQIKYNIVGHPEFLPDPNFAKITAFGFKNTKADIYWLETIQYIWWNAISSEYKKYLYYMLNLINELNPYFTHPYKIWLLLLPDYNPRYEKLTKEEQKNYILQAEKIWLKWIENLCDKKKIDLIKKEDNLNKIWTEKKYANPCKDYLIPYYLAFDYYFYLHDPIKASTYYKITSANKDAVEWAKILAAIMRWKWWDREKAFLMFVNIWKSLDNSKDKTCSKFADLLENKVAYPIFRENNLDYRLIKLMNESRDKIFWNNEEDNSKNLDKQCSNYINKATREINLYYIEQANKKYKKDTWKNAKNAKVLYDKWYIKYLPIDYQKSKDYSIIYKYNKDTKHFDYEMWYY
jgi:hypothetical protein